MNKTRMTNIGGEMRPPSTARSQTFEMPPTSAIPRNATKTTDPTITTACNTSNRRKGIIEFSQIFSLFQWIFPVFHEKQ